MRGDMGMIVKRIVLFGIMAALSPARAQSLPDLDKEVMVLDGNCAATSKVAFSQGDSTQEIPFPCDKMVVSFHRKPRTFLIQFTDTKSKNEQVVGYAGDMGPNDDTLTFMRVNRLYILREPHPAQKGECILTWNAKVLSTVVCGGRASVGDDVTATTIMGFEVGK